MKAALVYTSTTPELIELVEREVRKNIGEEAELLSLQNPEILAMVRDAGYVTPRAAAELIWPFCFIVISMRTARNVNDEMI